MNNNQPTSKTPQINETIKEAEIYFDTLLKNQQENSSNLDNKLKLVKKVSLFILVLIISLGFYYAIQFYLSSTSSKYETVSISENTTPAQTGYFVPDYSYTNSRVLSGKISENISNTGDRRQNFELIENNGKTIAYLFSDNNDLSLSVGLTVEIQGELAGRTDSGREIIEVKTIKFK